MESLADSFRVSSHRLNSTSDEQQGITQTIILTSSRSVGCLPHYCQAPSSATHFTSWVWSHLESNPGLSHQADAPTTRLWLRGRRGRYLVAGGIYRRMSVCSNSFSPSIASLAEIYPSVPWNTVDQGGTKRQTRKKTLCRIARKFDRITHVD